MPRLSLFTALLFFAFTARGAEVVRVAPWEFHDSFWMSLHATLIEDASHSKPRTLEGWSAEEQAAWNGSVEAYRTAGGHTNLTFAKPMVITSDAITQVPADAADPAIDAPLAPALKRAAPAYRAHLWASDEKANAFFIAYASAMVREEGAELIRQHEAVYRTKWPERILVYITPYGGPFGAYTNYGLSGGWITTMSWRDEGYQGLRALEMLLHESSHAVVNPNNGTVAAAIAASGKRRGVPVPRDLWHAIVFETSSELTRRLLAARGETTFVPSSIDMFTRVWPQYREAMERYWIAYLDGHGTLEEAIDAIVGAVAKPATS